MKKVAVFENEFKQIKASFDGLNLIYFNEELEFSVYETSQKFGDLSSLSNFNFVVIDIHLSGKSNLDGFQLLEEILTYKFENLEIIVVTGLLTVREQLKNRGLINIPVVSKPVTLESLKAAFLKNPKAQ